MRLHGLMEGLYFHELDIREKIFVRLQLNFGAYITIITAMVYMAKTVDYSSPIWSIILFYVLLFLTLLPLLVSMRCTLIAFTGYEYLLFPSAMGSVKYKKNTESYCRAIAAATRSGEIQGEYDEATNSSRMVDDYVLDSLAECVERNSAINEQRNTTNRKSLRALFISLAPFTMAACLFVFMDLDASSPRKNFLIEDTRLRASVEQSSDKMKRSIDQLIKDDSAMTTNNTQQSQNSPAGSSQQPTSTPAPAPAPSRFVPPTPPERPRVRVSNETYNEPLPDKSKLLGEVK